jgi:sortase A
MRRALRIGGLAMIVAGVLCLAWALMVWRWQDPFTGLYTRWKQHQLAQQYEAIVAQWRPPTSSRLPTGERRKEIARAAAAYRGAARPGQAIGRIVAARLGLSMVLVEGTDDDSLTKGPGRDPRTYMPGENRLVYIAGHRTTYLAPFARIDAIQEGDVIRLELPYATFVYRATGHEIVPADDLSVLRSPRRELLRLQACHPRFFASHRYLLDARLVRVEPRGGEAYVVQTSAADRQGALKSATITVAGRSP